MDMTRLNRVAVSIANRFLVWVILAAAIAFAWPAAVTWFKPYINPALGLIMFGMGITLTPADFRRVVETPRAVAIGILSQFLVMPLSAAVIAKLLRLPPPIAAGLILVGSCPGGTASNVMTYMAKGDVALSVTLTSVSTILSVAATPYLTQWLAGHYVPVNAPDLLRSILMIIIVPVVGGLVAGKLLGKRAKEIAAAAPILSVVFIAMIVACVVGLTRGRILESGSSAFIAVLLHNASGLAFGYGLARLARLDAPRCRTIAIEVGMQNSGLGVALATKHFVNPLVALPPALFSVWHNITGPALATFWARKIRAKNA